MRRALPIGVLCLALALLGVAGTHAHLAGGDHAHGAHHLHSYVVSFIDADHQADHDDDGDIDIDPLVKAFGTVSLTAPFVAIAIFRCLVELPVRGGLMRRLQVARPLRSSRDGPRFPFLPPSHAPPTPLV